MPCRRALPLLALLAALLALPAGTAAAPKAPAASAGPTLRTDKGVRFALPAGFAVAEKLEHEPGELNDTVYVATRGREEVRVEVEKGAMRCEGARVDGAPKAGLVKGRPACELATVAPPSLDPKVGPRRAVLLLVDFGDQHLSVFALAPTEKAALALARGVANSAEAAK